MRSYNHDAHRTLRSLNIAVTTHNRARIPAVAVFIGPDGVGPWQDKEVRTVLQRFANRSDPIVVPVILHDVEGTPKLPPFLSQYQWVDFRKTKDDPMKRLLWGITGKRGEFES